MSTREQLAEVIRDGVGVWRTPLEAADAILAALAPRTITTAAELDALPIGSVIRTCGVEHECEPRVATKDGFWTNESEWLVADDSEWCLSSDELDDLPATVLYSPAVAE